MNWQEYKNVFTNGWISDVVLDAGNRGHWRISRLSENDDNLFHLHFMKTETIGSGLDITRSTYHKAFQSFELARNYVEIRQKA